MTACWSAKEEAFVRNLNRKGWRHDRQFATGFAVREDRERLRLLARLADRRE
jgi:hypothetical protein